MTTKIKASVNINESSHSHELEANEIDRAETPELVSPEALNEPEERPDFGCRYEVLDLIGHGGMGSVYKVRDRQLDSVFAIKTLNRELVKDQVAQKRFEKEVEATTRLNHPSLATVYGYGVDASGAPYMVMDFVDGRSLDEIIEEVGALEPERACNILIQIAEGLQSAHLQGLVHRDIKPTNVIITGEGKLETAKLVDFGIAVALPTESRATRDLTQTGEVFGSPHYMSPEQCLGFMIDNRSDIYSFGCMMYETLTGKPPFSGSTPVQLIIDHINTDPKSFPRSVICNRLLTMMQRITMKCLLKEQSIRYQTMEELLKDLRLAQNGKSVQKISRALKIKFSLTKEKATAIAGLGLLMSLYSVSFDYSGKEELANAVSSIGPIILAAYCASHAFIQGFSQIKRLNNGKTTARSWLTIIMLLTGGSAAALAIPSLICAIGESKPDVIHAIAIVCRILGEGCASILGFSVLAYCIFGKQNLVRFKSVGLRVLSLALIWFFVATVALPWIGASTLTHLADKCRSQFPKTSITLWKASHQLYRHPYAFNTALHQASKQEERLGLYQDAIDTISILINQITKVEFVNVNLYMERAELFIRTNQLDKAEKDVRTYSELVRNENEEVRLKDPVLESPYSSAYMGLIRSRQGKFDEALSCYEHALKMEPSYHSTAYNFRIGTYARYRQYERAIAEINRSLQARSHSFIGYLKRAIIYENMGEKELARKDYELVCRLTQDTKQFRVPYGVAMLSEGSESHLIKAFANYKVGKMDIYKSEMKKAAYESRGNTHLKADLPYALHLGQSNLKWEW
ncbi:MAG: protein kinase [Candidatus Obscuribacterales bacterium]|nr:protein kinase [Candidatus Obscuribacterales bacterium]